MISKEQFLELKHLKSLGVPTTTICKKIGISVPSANKWLRMDEDAFETYLRNNTPYLEQYRAFILSILKICPHAGDKHHVSNQGSVSGFRLQEEHLFPVCENAAGADRIHQAGESPHLFPGGNTARLRSAGRFRSVQNEGHVRSEPVGVLLLHGIILQPDAICVFQPGAISDTDGH